MYLRRARRTLRVRRERRRGKLRRARSKRHAGESTKGEEERGGENAAKGERTVAGALSVDSQKRARRTSTEMPKAAEKKRLADRLVKNTVKC